MEKPKNMLQLATPTMYPRVNKVMQLVDEIVYDGGDGERMELMKELYDFYTQP